MSPILGIWASKYVAPTNFISIQTATVDSGGASSITFSSIPSTYTHLQLRILSQTNRATYGFDDIIFRFNSDSANNYARHYLGGDGGSAYSGAANTPSNYMYTDSIAGSSTANVNLFGVAVVDILDYLSTTKNKTVRTLGGTDLNGTVGGAGGRVTLNSGLWFKTPEAINSITLYPSGGTQFNQYSSFALYGVK